MRADVNHRNLAGSTALLRAATKNRRRTAKKLLAAGADPGVIDATGKGAMVYAAAKGFAVIVDTLLKAGIEVNTRYGNDLTALIWAAGHSNDVPAAEGLETVKLRLEGGAG